MTVWSIDKNPEAKTMVITAEFTASIANVWRLWADPRLLEIAAVLAPLGIFASRQPATFAGSDVEDLRSASVPVMRFSQDDRHYFDTHHSADDTLNKIDRADLSQNVAAWAALIYMVAENGVVLRARDP